MDFTITRIPKIISIEGNIGAGKTTFVQELKKRYENSREIIFLTELFFNPISYAISSAFGLPKLV